MEHRTSPVGIRLGDFLVIAAVLLTALLCFLVPLVFHGGAGTIVIIRTETGEQAYPLHIEREIPVTSAGYSLTVAIEGGMVRVADTDCPSGVCAATGAISAAGQSIVCAPAQVLITIQSDGGASDDKTPDVVLP